MKIGKCFYSYLTKLCVSDNILKVFKNTARFSKSSNAV